MIDPSQSAEHRAGPVSGPRYYKSDLRPLPVIFVQDPRSWTSFTPGGAVLEYCPGVIPYGRMAGLEEIDAAEAQRWLSAEAGQAPGPDGQPMTQERGAAAESVVYRPRRWRQCLFGPPAFVVLAYVAFAIWRIASSVSHPEARLQGELLGGLGLLLIVLFAVTFSVVKGRLSTYAFTVGSAGIAAQTGFWRQRSSGIALSDLNRVRSARRTLADRLLGRQCLYSKSGSRVVFARRYFDGEVTRDLFGRLGIDL